MGIYLKLRGMKRSDIEIRCVKILSEQPDLIANPLVVQMRDYLISLIEKSEKRYEENDKFDGSWKEFVLLFNSITGKNIKPKTANVKAKKQLNALLGIYSIEDLGRAVSACWESAKGNSWAAGITPEYMTRPDKFETWYNQSQRNAVNISNQNKNPNAKYFAKN